VSAPLARLWPNYDVTPMEIWEEPSFSVYDPWTAQLIGTFPTRGDAELFIEARMRKWASEVAAG